MKDAYKEAGVDVQAGYESVALIKKHIQRTVTEGVLGGIGSFSGLFQINLNKYPTPVLVSGTDGVGTKLKLAHHRDRCGGNVRQRCIVSGSRPVILFRLYCMRKELSRYN